MFEKIVGYLQNIHPVTAALYATLFTWFVTALGASTVYFFKKPSRSFLDCMLGFTGGVMIAASYWSLLAPAIEMSPGTGFTQVLPSAIGFVLGAFFLFGIDKLLPILHINFQKSNDAQPKWRKTALLVIAITLHNIPEGLAVGVIFGGVASGFDQATIAGAVILAIGIGLQNFPEGIAVSVPLRRMGWNRHKSFFMGQMSGMVEPIAGVLGALAVSFFTPILPYALAFSAGAMIFVVVKEIIPESQKGKNNNLSTFGFITGFVVMMSLDVALGG